MSKPKARALRRALSERLRAKYEVRARARQPSRFDLARRYIDVTITELRQPPTGDRSPNGLPIIDVNHCPCCGEFWMEDDE